MEKANMRKCMNFNCDKLHGHYCCADCGYRKSCANPCRNHPSRCGLAEEPEGKFPPLPQKRYCVIYADPPWNYKQGGTSASSHGIAKQHYATMPVDDICAIPVRSICAEDGAACFLWATFPNITEAVQVMEAWGFQYKTAAFVWVKKNRKDGGNYMGLGAYTRANAEVCLLGVTPGFKAGERVRCHHVRQVIEAPRSEHSEKPDEARRRIVELLGDVPRIELFARRRADGWDAWGDEAPAERGRGR